MNIKEEITEVQWLEEADYKVNFNKNGILGVTFSVSGSGAYPSVYEKSVIVDLKTGERVLAKDVFDKLPELAAKCKAAQKAEMEKQIAEIKREMAEDADGILSFFENTDFTAENLDEFAVSETGVIFWYDYGFPHVALALQPEGRYFFSWAELKHFIKRNGLLAQFNR